MNKKEQSRLDALLPLKNNVRTPRWIRCYDNGGATADRYTIVFTRQSDPECMFVSCNSNPVHPVYGVYQHGYSKQPIDVPSYKHIGKKITFLDLPGDVQSCVRYDYLGLWDIKLE